VLTRWSPARRLDPGAWIGVVRILFRLDHPM
jgi:hypothetical protein